MQKKFHPDLILQKKTPKDSQDSTLGTVRSSSDRPNKKNSVAVTD